jgi:hypothetical protein
MRFLACSILLLGGLGAATDASATPIRYDLTFNAPVGPSGIGSFVYDDATSLMTGFTWTFGSETGGLTDEFLASLTSDGSPSGSNLLEIITHTDADPNADCLSRSCGFGIPVLQGTGPLGTTIVAFISPNPPDTIATYAFADSNANIITSGFISFVTTAVDVPETGTLELMIGALLLVAVLRRRRSTRATPALA